MSVIDKYHHLIKETFESFGISFDNYARTSDSIHHETSKDFFKKLDKKGIFEIKTSEQLYDENENQFLADRYVVGECPKCGHKHAYGDQCENCGASLSPNDLINPKSRLSGSKPILKETKHWYLPLGNYEDFLNKWIIEGKKGKWKPNTPVAIKANATKEINSLKSTFKPYMTSLELEKIGLESTETIPGNLKLLPISLDLSEGDEYWIGFDNYQSISRYNRSKLYVMAVFEFSNVLSEFL